MDLLKNKVAIVTGAASRRGIGRSIAIKLAGEGADVVVADKFNIAPSIRPEDKGWDGLEAVVKEIQALGRDGLAVPMDISNPAEVDNLVDKTLAKFKKIDILVNCAGIRGPVPTPMLEITEADWRMVIDTNINGAFFLAKAVAKAMLLNGEGKKIVMVSSQVGVKGIPGSSAYSVSKHGVEGIIKNLALEMAKYKINVNGIRPGAIDTNFRDSSLANQAKVAGITVEEALQNDAKGGPAAMIPFGRMGTPEEIADLVLFLVSDQSKYITGEIFTIAGGMA
ncbi:MAG: SDR family NAD(P)-dependent oxidoreductase [Dehalococcoidales bacterium]|nr:SDR family NAD(P)-dependent oxidoreductase [Dehalococcoidales bacterium]